MSTQNDEVMMGHFEIFGEDYAVIVPGNITELAAALNVRDELEKYISSLLDNEDSIYYERILEEQSRYITEYADHIGDFDNAVFVQNIGYLTDKYGIRIGELERLLGISVGYISRTAKENSGKRMSVDIAWKIARFFNVDLKSLLETELDSSRNNLQLTVQFIEKLISDTNLGRISWKKQTIDDSRSPLIFNSKVLTISGSRVSGYNLSYERFGSNNPSKKYNAEVVYSCKDVFEDKELSLVSFKNNRKVCYDMILVWGEGAPYSCSVVTHSDEDKTGQIAETAALLIKAIRSQKKERHMSGEVRNLITQYLK